MTVRGEESRRVEIFLSTLGYFYSVKGSSIDEKSGFFVEMMFFIGILITNYPLLEWGGGGGKNFSFCQSSFSINEFL